MTSESTNLPYQKIAQLLTLDMQLDAGVLLILEEYAENEVEISNLQITEQGRGLGSKTIQNSTRLADCHGINLMVIPAGAGERRERRVGFYSRLGFQEDGDLMRFRAKLRSHGGVG